MTAISFEPVFFISVYSTYIHIYLFLSLAYPSQFPFISLSIQFDAYLFYLFLNPKSRVSFSIPFFYLCLLNVYPPPFCLFSIHLYFFVPLYQSKFTAISFEPVFFISVYSSYINLYFFLSLFQSRLTLISFYRFVNPNSRVYLSTPFSWSLSNLRISTYICFYLLPIHLYFFLSLCQSRLTLISVYLSVNPNSRAYFSIPFSLSPSNLCISTYICFYLLPINLYFFLSPCQSRLTLFSFYLFVNPNSRLYLWMFNSLFQYIPLVFTSITFYLLYISLSIQAHANLFQYLSLLVDRSTNLVHIVSLITNN